MRYKTKCRIQDGIMATALATGVFLAATESSRADDILDPLQYHDCPDLIGGIYKPSISGQPSNCALDIYEDPLMAPVFLAGQYRCKDDEGNHLPPVSVPVTYWPSPNSCTVSADIRARFVLIEEEGQVILEGIFTGMDEPLVGENVSEQDVCQAAKDAGLLVANHEVLTVEAVHISDPNGPDDNPVSQFACEGTYWHTSWQVVRNFGPVNVGRLNVIAIAEPRLQEADALYELEMEVDKVSGDMAGTARVTTNGVRGANPAAVTLTKQ